MTTNCFIFIYLWECISLAVIIPRILKLHSPLQQREWSKYAMGIYCFSSLLNRYNQEEINTHKKVFTFLFIKCACFIFSQHSDATWAHGIFFQVTLIPSHWRKQDHHLSLIIGNGEKCPFWSQTKFQTKLIDILCFDLLSVKLDLWKPLLFFEN